MLTQGQPLGHTIVWSRWADWSELDSEKLVLWTQFHSVKHFMNHSLHNYHHSLHTFNILTPLGGHWKWNGEPHRITSFQADFTRAQQSTTNYQHVHRIHRTSSTKALLTCRSDTRGDRSPKSIRSRWETMDRASGWGSGGFDTFFFFAESFFPDFGETMVSGVSTCPMYRGQDCYSRSLAPNITDLQFSFAFLSYLLSWLIRSPLVSWQLHCLCTRPAPALYLVQCTTSISHQCCALLCFFIHLSHASC